MKEPSFKIGIGEEYQIIDPQTRELKSYITQFLDQGQVVMGESLKPELPGHDHLHRGNLSGAGL